MVVDVEVIPTVYTVLSHGVGTRGIGAGVLAQALELPRWTRFRFRGTV